MGDYTSLGAPQSRNEAILMNMLGATYELGNPQSRIEYLLQEILDNGGGGGTGTDNYNSLSNKPQINSVELKGNKSLHDLGIDIPVVDDALSESSENTIQNKVVTLALNDKLQVSASMPTAASAYLGKQRLYIGTTTEDYLKGMIYECQTVPGSSPLAYAWVAISSAQVTVDDELSTTSENPVQNKVVTLALNDKLGITDTMPTAAAALEGKQRLYVGASNANYTKGNIYECQEVTPATSPKTYTWVVINKADITVDNTLSTTSKNPVQNRIVTNALNERLVVTDTMPTAAAALEGKQRLYVGSTNSTYTNGLLYECQEITPATDPKTYHWVCISVDDDISYSSEKPLQNKVVASELDQRLIVTVFMPEASLDYEEQQRLYVGSTNEDYTKGNIYECREVKPSTSPKTYHWVVINKADIEIDAALSTTSENPVQNKVVTGALNARLIITDTMPTAAEALEGKQRLYVGATDANYTKGMIYECQEVTPATDPKTYTWIVINDIPIVIDAALSTTSEHPVQNKVVTGALNEKLSFTSTMPTATAALEGKELLFVGASTEDFAKGFIYECQEVTPATDPKTYHWVCINAVSIPIDAALSTTSENPVQNKIVTGALNERLVVSDTMPAASADLEGKQRLYIGATNANYTKGNIYECQEVTPATDPATYTWVVINKADIVLDNAPTASSNNAVKSGGVYADENKIYQAAGILGAKNLNPFPYKNGGAGDTWETNGITFTVGSDGSITADGTATADAYFRCGISTDNTNPIALENGKSYILSGSGQQNVSVRLRNSNNTGVANATITDTTYTCDSTGSYYMLIEIGNGITVDNLVIYPMIRLASDTDNTFRPYAATNKELTDRVAALENRLNNLNAITYG